MTHPIDEQLGGALGRLITELGTSLLRYDEIAVTPSRTARRTYRLAFEDGRILKGRYFRSCELAALAERIVQTVAAPWWPQVVARRDDAMLEQWIDGDVLVQGRVDAPAIREAGRMLGALHQSQPPALHEIGYTPMNRSAWVDKIRRNLAMLTEASLLSPGRSAQLESQALSELPEKSDIGVVHRDLCPENLVRDRKGRLFGVDNGSLSIGSIAEDLCRVWYRWPMRREERQAFAEGYSAFGDPTAFCQPSAFWMVAVVTNSARVRLSHSRRIAASALERLSHFFHRCGQGREPTDGQAS